MKCLIVLSALVALSAAGLVSPYGYSGLPLAYSGLSPYGYSGLSASPLLGHSVYAAPAYTSTVVAGPSVVAAPSVYAAPAVVAAPSVYAAPAVVAAPALTGVKSQYHAQDELGQASYGHAEPTQSHSAVQDAHGNKVGSFSYVAPDGRVLRTDYVADALGYRVASNALPVGPGAGPAPVADTPEVVAARVAHLAAHARAKRGLVAVGHTPAATAPLAHVAYAAPLQYAAVQPQLAYSAVHSPLVYSSVAHSPLTYSSVAHSPLAYSAPAVAHGGLVREATLTTVVNTPGHAVSYRVD